jgi:hypothetical protein
MKKNMEAFEILFNCLSSDNVETKERLEKYVLHRKMFGRQAAARIYPDCHNIIIHDPLLKECWTDFLKTVDKL